jgi:hypothetical protein
MSIAPPSNPAQAARETRRARLAVLAATVGIAATLLAYGLAPGVRHVVGRAAHSVKHAVSHVFDPDAGKAHAPAKKHAPTRAPARVRSSTHHGRAGAVTSTGKARAS